MYSVTVNKEKFAVEKKAEDFWVNGSLLNWDLEKIDERTFHLLKNHLSYMVELVHINIPQKTVTIKINNKIAEVVIKDRFDLLLEKLGMNTPSAHSISDIKAPMPGLILEIKVKAGEMIKKGDPLMVLEAMKMENMLKAPGDALVKEVLVDIGSSVEKNQVLINFE